MDKHIISYCVNLDKHIFRCKNKKNYLLLNDFGEKSFFTGTTTL